MHQKEWLLNIWNFARTSCTDIYLLIRMTTNFGNGTIFMTFSNLFDNLWELHAQKIILFQCRVLLKEYVGWVES